MDPRELERILQYLMDLFPMQQGGPPGALPMSDPTGAAPLPPGPPPPVGPAPGPRVPPGDLGGVDPEGFAAHLQAMLAAQPQNMGAPQPPSDWNAQMPEMGGREGPPMAIGPQAPQDEFLQYLTQNQPINPGPPPGPEMVSGPGGGIGVNSPDVMAPQYLRPPQEQLPPSHPPATLDFLRGLLENRPELMQMQTPPNPTGSQDAQMLAVAIELMNEQLQAGGQAPVESQDRGAGGLRAFAEGGGRTPEHAENIMRSAQRKAQTGINQLPSPVQGMLDPNAAGKIAENPGGRLTDWVSELLGRTGNANPTDPGAPEQQLRLRTNQADALLGAGPERSSLLQGLSPAEGAVARQAGGMEPFVTGMGGMSRDPAAAGNAGLEAIAPGLSQILYPEAGLPEPAATPPVGGRGMTAEDIAGQNRGFFAELTSQIPHDWNPRPGEGAGQMPTASMPGEGMDPEAMSFIDELKRMLWMQENNPEAGRFPEAPGPGTRLDQSVAQMEGAPEQVGFGPDMLEQRPSQSLGLDEAGNIRAGSPGGRVMSGSWIEQMLGRAKGAARGIGEGALGLAPNALDMYSANSFANALTGANEEFGGVMTPNNLGEMVPVKINPGMAALYSMVPFLFDRRRFAEDPQYRRDMLGPENIPEAA